MIKKHLIFLAILILAISCEKKDRLNKDKEILIGKWNWTESLHAHDFCEGPLVKDYITPETEGHHYAMKFEKKGYIYFFQDDIEIANKRIVFTGFGDYNGDSTYKSFAIYLDNDKNQRLTGQVKEDSIIIKPGFPYASYNEGCETYTSYFIRK